MPARPVVLRWLALLWVNQTATAVRQDAAEVRHRAHRRTRQNGVTELGRWFVPVRVHVVKDQFGGYVKKPASRNVQVAMSVRTLVEAQVALMPATRCHRLPRALEQFLEPLVNVPVYRTLCELVATLQPPHRPQRRVAPFRQIVVPRHWIQGVSSSWQRDRQLLSTVQIPRAARQQRLHLHVVGGAVVADGAGVSLNIVTPPRARHRRSARGTGLSESQEVSAFPGGYQSSSSQRMASASLRKICIRAPT